MKKNTVFVGLAIAVLSLAYQARAQDSLVEHLYESCKVDIESFCSQVTPGGGRMLHCMAAHVDKISGRCNYALYQASAALEQMASAIAYVARQCKSDIEMLCRDVKEGDGRVMMCLKESAEEVSDACNQAVKDVSSN